MRNSPSNLSRSVLAALALLALLAGCSAPSGGGDSRERRRRGHARATPPIGGLRGLGRLR